MPSILGKFFNIPVYIILHGTDSVAFKEIGYGNLLRPLLKYFSKLSYKYAKQLLPVSDSLISTDNGYFSENVIKLGILNHFPDLKLTYTTIYNGLDLEFWKPASDGVNSRSDSCITVISKGQEVRKGLKLIEKLAFMRPDYDFYIAGLNAPDTGNQMPNIKYLDVLKPLTLREYYRSSKFYLQLSIFEGFGLSLCEAMLCGCVPIGSHVNMIPEIIGDSGYILERMDEKELLDIFNRASSDKLIEEKSLRAMKRISENYPIALRKELLLKALILDSGASS
ncbi:MAG: glycosyltransferase family 4 protein [Saprospiraceae bacterium]|nr:glycosyltransferase family 4 protein [Saprospiraceae bacterium]